MLQTSGKMWTFIQANSPFDKYFKKWAKIIQCFTLVYLKSHIYITHSPCSSDKTSEVFRNFCFFTSLLLYKIEFFQINGKKKTLEVRLLCISVPKTKIKTWVIPQIECKKCPSFSIMGYFCPFNLWPRNQNFSNNENKNWRYY